MTTLPTFPELAPDRAGDADPLSAVLAGIERRAGAAVLARAARVELLLCDVDGVMTDGGLIRGDDELESKRFHARDTIGIRQLQASGVRVAIVSGRRSPTLAARARELGVDELHQGCHDKREALGRILAATGVVAARAAYLGDDVVDLPPMRRVHLALCPADAHPLVRACAHHALEHGGGSAVARDACELIMHARGTLRTVYAAYLE